ncbi:MAG: translocation/assembly module TamB domain-containing protein [Flavobacteriaceae bacterium]
MFYSCKFKTLKGIKKLIKIIKRTLQVLLLLLLIGMVLLSMPAVQSSLAKSATDRLNTTYGVSIFMDRLGLNWKGELDLRQVLIRDHHGDTIISSGQITTNLLSLNDLFRGHLNFDYLRLNKALLRITTYKDEDQHSLSYFINQFVKNDSIADSSDRAFVLRAGDLSLINTTIEVIDHNQMDPQMVSFTKLFLQGDQFYVNGPEVGARINSMGFESSFGLDIAGLSGNYRYTPRQMFLEKFALKTPNQSLLEGDLTLTYDQGMADFVNKVYIALDLRPSEVANDDINRWYPEMGSNEFLRINGSLHGIINELHWDEASLEFGDSQLSGTFAFNDMFGAEPFVLTGKSLTIKTNRKDLTALMPRVLGNNLPKNLQRLGLWTLKGDLSLEGDVLTYKGALASRLGAVKTDITIGNLRHPDYAFYKGTISTKAFNLGRLMGWSDFGRITGDMSVDGRGFTQEALKTKIVGHWDSWTYKGYAYQNITLTGDLMAPFFGSAFSVNDPNLQLTLEGVLDRSKGLDKMELKADITYAELNKLGLFVRDSVSIVTGNIDAVIQGTHLEDLTGEIVLTNTFYQTQDDAYFFDDLHLRSIRDGEERVVAVTSPDVINGNIRGQFTWSDLGPLFQNAVASNYFNYTPIEVAPNQYASFDFTIYNKIVGLFVPAVELGSQTQISGQVGSDIDDFALSFTSPELLLYGAYLGAVSVSMDNDHPLYRSALSVDSIYTGERYFNDVRWVNGGGRDTLVAQAAFFGGPKKQDHYAFDIYHTRNLDQQAIFGINKSEIKLADHTWYLNQGEEKSELIIDPNQSMRLERLTLSNNEEVIALSGFKNDTTDMNVQLSFDKVRVNHILPKIDRLALSGLLNGKLQLNKTGANYFPSSNLMLTDLGINEVPLGDLTVSIRGDSDLINYRINTVLMQGLQKKFQAIGSLEVNQGEPLLDLNVSMRDFDLAALSPLGGTVLSDIKGLAQGSATITGKYTAPSVVGYLRLNQTRLRIPYLNVDLQIPDATQLEILNTGFVLPPTILTDTKYGTNAELSGLIAHNRFADWNLDLNMTTDRFLALDTPEEETQLYYGTTFIDGGATIKGPIDELVINVNARTQQGTTFKIPISDVATIGDDSFIRFISPQEQKARIKGETFVADEIKGLTINFDLDINDQAEVEILVDPVNNSKFKGRGSGLLFIEINTLGKFKMWGEFVIIEGNYDFKYGGIVNKSIDVVPGGRISWNGEPDQAQLDLTAKYTVDDVNPSALLDNPSLNSTVDVAVLLNLTGQILQPELDFQLQFPNVSTSVREELNVKLRDKEQRQLQAIYLAATGSFQGEGGQNIVGTLTERVNTLVADLLSDSDAKFKILPTIGTRQVDLNDQLEYNVGVQISTQITERILINGKVAVPVGGANESAVAGDIQVQWLVNDDGSLRMNFFNRQADLQFIGENQIFEQGAGASYSVDFSTFKELVAKLFGQSLDKER